MNDTLVWVDLETTGLDPFMGRILEVGAIVTDGQLNSMGIFSMLVGPELSAVEAGLLHPAVQSMHEGNGLLSDLRELSDMCRDLQIEMPDIYKADQALADFLRSFSAGDGSLMLAGSSVHFDRSWMKAHMPKSERLFHYRNADVSALREFIGRWLPGVDPGRVPQRKKHRSVDDLEDTLALAMFYKGVIMDGAP